MNSLHFSFSPASRLGRLFAGFALSAFAHLASAQSAGTPLTVTTIAGTANATGEADGTGTAARFLNPSGLVIDKQGNLFVADSGNNTIRKITPAGVVTTFAGQAVDPSTGVHNNGGTADGTGAAAQFSFGKSVIDAIGSNTLAIDANDNIYVADTLNNRIRKITPGAVVTTPTLRDGSGNSVQLNSPDGIAIDPGSNLYVTDSGTNTIRKITQSGVVTLFAGNSGGSAGNTDGTGTAARFDNPRGIACDSAGNLYVADSNNNTIRKITPGGVVTTIAGSPLNGPPTHNSAGTSDGLAKNARFNSPIGLALDSGGNLYIADRGNNSVRRLTPAGVVSTVAGLSGTAGASDGTGNASRLRQPYSVVADSAGNVYIADTKSQTIRKGVNASSPSTITITAQPRIQIVNSGQSATFSVAATATPSPTYQWQKNGVNIPGAVNSSYTIGSPQTSDDRTYYTAVVTSGTSSFTSSAAQLQVYFGVNIPPVVILTQPSDTTVTAGNGATFSVEAGGSGGTLNYRWQKVTGGVPADVVGATSPDFNLPSAQAADAGTYQVVVTNPSVAIDNVNNPLTSNTVTLNVDAAQVVPVAITTQPQSQTISAGQGATFSVTATGSPSPTYQWQKDGASIAGATFFSYSILAVQAADAGTYRVVVTNSAGSVTSSGAVLTVTAAASAPVITQQPADLSVNSGTAATFSVTATGTPAPTYQWQKDGTNISGATSASYTIPSAQISDVASYRVVVSNSAGSTTSSPAALTVTQSTINPARLINLSILAPIAAGETMTMGTVLGGTGTTGNKPLVARAAGPSLSQFGITAFLPDPTMKLNNTSSSPAVVIDQNDNWNGSASLASAFASVGAFGYTSAASKDAGIYQSALATGNYTVQVSDTGTGSGTVIAELYDATPTNSFTAQTPRLINVSVLKNIAAGTTLTAGFVIGGAPGTTMKVLVRAVGPTLGVAPFNIGGVMADPKLELFDNATQAKINENNDWGGAATLSAAFTTVAAFQLASATTKDAVLLVTLAPGQYSARVSGADGGGGVAIVEVYEVP